MSVDSLEVLLMRLNRGDLSAAEEIVRTCEPILRTVVRRSLPGNLRAKFDSMDVVQSVWVHLLLGLHRKSWTFPDRAHLMGLLVTIARRRLFNRVRHYQPGLERFQPEVENLDRLANSYLSHPGEDIQAEELWDRMLNLCPADHRELLRLKKEGLSVAQIADRTGLHQTTVRRVLRQVSSRLAMENEPSGAR